MPTHEELLASRHHSEHPAIPIEIEPPFREFPVDQAMSFFERLKIQKFVTDETRQKFIEAALSVIGDQGIPLWIDEVHHLKEMTPDIVKQILSCQVEGDPNRFFHLLCQLHDSDIEIDEEMFGKAVVRNLGAFSGSLSPEFRGRSAQLMVDIFQKQLPFGRLSHEPLLHNAYEKFPSFHDLYEAVQAVCVGEEIGPFVNMAPIRFRDLFDMIFKGIGVFTPAGWDRWAEFISFHRFLVRSIGAYIQFPGQLPFDFADLPPLYDECVRCEEEEVSEKLTAFKGRLCDFERYVHDRRLEDDSRYD
jgi:hypothetical protein